MAWYLARHPVRIGRAAPMKVAYLTHYADLYGANRCMLDLLLAMRAAHGVEPHVLLAQDGPLVAELQRHQVPHAVLPWVPWVERRVYMGGPHHRLLQHLRYLKRVRQRMAHNNAVLPGLAAQCRAWGIDMLHVNSSVIGIGPALAKALERPWVWHVRELFGLHYGYSVDGGVKAFRRALHHADAVVAMSQAVRRQLHRQVGDDLRVEVVYDGLVDDAYAAAIAARATERWQASRPFRFVLMGLFHPAKGQLEAVDGLAAVRARGVDAHLVLVGGGRTAPVEERVKALGLGPYVAMPGFVADAWPYYLDAHCALTCSRHEAYGRVTVEALTAGMPVIGHASGGTPELIEDGVTGLLYDSPAQLQEHMHRLAADPALARQMGDAALHGVAARRRIADMARDMRQVYWSVAGRTTA